MQRLFADSIAAPTQWLSRRTLIAALGLRTLADLPDAPPQRFFGAGSLNVVSPVHTYGREAIGYVYRIIRNE